MSPGHRNVVGHHCRQAINALCVDPGFDFRHQGTQLLAIFVMSPFSAAGENAG
ncbi:MAG: hypothetical protein IPN64_15495 [Propionivibrio sp.]|nr:hypothetical protein [Propionivibrio sp.]